MFLKKEMMKDILVIVPALEVVKRNDGKIILTDKFLNGTNEFVRHWAGVVKVLMYQTPIEASELDNIEVRVSELPFDVEIINGEITESYLNEADIVLASLTYKNAHLPGIVNKLNIPIVYISESTFKTKVQRLMCSDLSNFKKIKSFVWHLIQESRYRKAISLSQGLQCNGTPTYKSYQKINISPMLFFDNRIEPEMLISVEELAMRNDRLLNSNCLRLAFSGRLLSMKGAMDLVKVAKELDNLNVSFTLSIFGDGNQIESMRGFVDKHNLSNKVTIKGNVDFKSELVPFMKGDVDLFVCCHKQGDPSCTYIETLACGVPIIGFDNEALNGIIEYRNIGWIIEINEHKKMARKIRELARKPIQIIDASKRARDLASNHLFNNEFRRRSKQLQLLVNNN